MPLRASACRQPQRAAEEADALRQRWARRAFYDRRGLDLVLERLERPHDPEAKHLERGRVASRVFRRR